MQDSEYPSKITHQLFLSSFIEWLSGGRKPKLYRDQNTVDKQLICDTIRICQVSNFDGRSLNFFLDVHCLPALMSNPAAVVDGDLTFASRNPFKETIPSRARQQHKHTDAQKASADAKRAINKENANALQVELNDFFDLRGVEITRLAKKFNKSEVKIKQLLSNETTYKKTRAPSLRNALVYAKGVEMNEGK